MTNKKLLVDAIIGGKSCAYGEYGEYSTFCGNQWNPDWCWNRKKLETLPINILEDIYYRDDFSYIKVKSPQKKLNDNRTVKEKMRDLYPSVEKLLERVVGKDGNSE